MTRLSSLSLMLATAVAGILAAPLGEDLPPVYNHSNHPQWLSWKQTHEKTYASVSEEAHRFGIFIDKMGEIEAHNIRFAAGLETYTKGLNQFSDLTTAEWRELVTCTDYSEFVRSIEAMGPEYAHNDTTVAAGGVDWRSKGKVSSVKNQNPCGACWAFATAGGIESAYAIAKNAAPVDLSPQNLLDCMNIGCNTGGWPDKAYNFVKTQGGLDTEKSYPWGKGKTGKCAYNKANNGATISGVQTTNSESALASAVAKTPTTITITIGDSFQSYKAGTIFSDPSCSKSGPHPGGHALVVVGYTDTTWIIKNSWSAAWGDKGYMNMARGKGICGIGPGVYATI